MLTAPLVLTACNSYEYVEEEDGSVKLNPDKLYSYDEVKNLHIVNVKTKINEKVYLTNIDLYMVTGWPWRYHDVFTGRVIITCNSNNEIQSEGIEMLSDEKIEQYLISYNMLKDKYSVTDLQVLFEKIKQDVYSDTNNKELVKEK